jgi:hypothetical protein
MKAAYNNNTDKNQALNEMLSSYRATPHPATGIAPGNMLFRAGYKKDFPRTKADQDEVNAALAADREKKRVHWEEINLSNHRVESNILPNQLVYTRNNVRNKFDPIFGPELYQVVDVKGNGTTLLRLSDCQLFRRHLDDVKDASAVEAARSCNNDTCWINSDLPIPLDIPHPFPNNNNNNVNNPNNIPPAAAAAEAPRDDDQPLPAPPAASV